VQQAAGLDRFNAAQADAREQALAEAEAEAAAVAAAQPKTAAERQRLARRWGSRASKLDGKLARSDWWGRKLEANADKLAGLSAQDRLVWLAGEAAADVAADAGTVATADDEAAALDVVMSGAVSDELLDALLGPLPSEERMLEQFDLLPYDYQNLLIRDSIARVGL